MFDETETGKFKGEHVDEFLKDHLKEMVGLARRGGKQKVVMLLQLAIVELNSDEPSDEKGVAIH